MIHTCRKDFPLSYAKHPKFSSAERCEKCNSSRNLRVMLKDFRNSGLIINALTFLAFNSPRCDGFTLLVPKHVNVSQEREVASRRIFAPIFYSCRICRGRCECELPEGQDAFPLRNFHFESFNLPK